MIKANLRKNRQHVPQDQKIPRIITATLTDKIGILLMDIPIGHRSGYVQRALLTLFAIDTRDRDLMKDAASVLEQSVDPNDMQELGDAFIEFGAMIHRLRYEDENAA
jgi:hypothetical protein